MKTSTLVRVPEPLGTDGLGIWFQDGSDEGTLCGSGAAYMLHASVILPAVWLSWDACAHYGRRGLSYVVLALRVHHSRL